MRFPVVVVSKIFHQNTNSNYTKYNNSFGHIVGVTCAVMMSKLAQMYEAYINELVSHDKYGDRWFYATIDNIEYQTCLTRREQETAIQKLKSMGIIEVAVFGTPAKRFFRINEDKLNEYLGIKIELLDCRNVQTSNHKYKNKAEKPRKEPEINQKEITRLAETPNCFGGNGSHGLINTIQEHKRENIRENTYAPSGDSANEPASFSSANQPTKEMPVLVEGAPNVKVTRPEHDKLVEKFGVDLVMEGYDDLSEWKKSANPKQVAKHASDYYRLRKWVIPDLLKRQADAERIKQQAIAPHRRGSKMVTSGDYDSVAPKIKRF